MRIAYRFAPWITCVVHPELPATIRDIHQRGWLDLTIAELNMKLYYPVMGSLLAAVFCPILVSGAIVRFLDLPADASDFLLANAHLLTMIAATALFISRSVKDLLLDLSNRIRDDHYLIGRQLHNLERNVVASENGNSASDSEGILTNPNGPLTRRRSGVRSARTPPS